MPSTESDLIVHNPSIDDIFIALFVLSSGMLEPLRVRYRSVRQELRRTERRELRDLRRWLEDTQNLLGLTALVVVPLLIGLITWVSNVSPVVSFFVYPPLASGTYTLFADPEGRYSSPHAFVGGMTLGALSGWTALEISVRVLYTVPPEQFHVHAGAATLGIFLTGVTTWLFGVEEPTAYSSALLVLVTGSAKLTYVAGIAVSSLLVAGTFAVWRRRFYRGKSRYLFRSTSGHDHVLVPIREGMPESVAIFAARIAAAHDTGKVLLVETVESSTIEETEVELATTGSPASEDVTGEPDVASLTDAAEERIVDRAVERLARLESKVGDVVDVSCESVVVVEGTSTGETLLQTARNENCDLVVAPYETGDNGPAPFVQTLLTGDVDTVIFSPSNGRTEWNRILAMVHSSGPVANSMLDFAQRLAGQGTISACTCISDHHERRDAEILLETLVESLTATVDTQIHQGTVTDFLESNASLYDLAVLGARADREQSLDSYLTATLERGLELDCDVAIVHCK